MVWCARLLGVALLVGLVPLLAPPAAATVGVGPIGPPAIAADAPDPEVVHDGTKYWLYTTQVGGMAVPVRWSNDLVAWSAPTDALGAGLGAWANPGFTWSPGVTRIGSTWVMYYTANERFTGRQCLGRATAASPGGPFVDPSPGPFLCQREAGGSIDADVFTGPGGGRWLLWKSDGNAVGQPSALWSAALNADGSLFASNPVPLVDSRTGPEAGVIENPTMHFDGTRYHLLYSVGPYESTTYAMGHATCAGPSGPCTRTAGAERWLADDTGVPGPGGGSVFTDHLGRPWLAFHGWRPVVGYSSGGVRMAWLVPLDVGPVPVLRFDLPRHQEHRLPIGQVDSATLGAGVVHVQGWVLDDDRRTTPVSGVISLVGAAGTRTAPFVADLPRPDVGAAYPGAGDQHGFATSVPIATRGTFQVCIDADDLGPGGRRRIACRSLDAGASTPPRGNVDGFATDATSATVSGWAFDPDHAGPVAVDVTVNGTRAATVVADDPRPDVGQAFGIGPDHGFAARVALPAGASTVCATATDVDDPAVRSSLGCRSALRRSGSPLGNIDAVVRRPGGVALSGWALDPDTAAPIEVHLWSAGRFLGWVRADRPRPDVAALFPGLGDAHGFSLAVGLPSGRHAVCAYAVSGSADPPRLLGCPQVDVSPVPIGNVDAMSRSGGIVVLDGWALDPDTAAPIEVHVASGGRLLGYAVADRSRPDVGAAFPAYGSAHGFRVVATAPPAGQVACAYAIDHAAGQNRPLGCF